MSTAEKVIETQSTDSFLVFKIGGEYYGAPLLEIREVIEYQEPKFVPNMAPAFLGVINLRGSIIGVVDLRKRIGLAPELSKYTSLLVCETEEGTLAALVDRVESVVSLGIEKIETEAPLQTKVESTFVTGIAKDEKRLVTLLDIKGLLMEKRR